jgi:hypothetical protein
MAIIFVNLARKTLFIGVKAMEIYRKFTDGNQYYLYRVVLEEKEIEDLSFILLLPNLDYPIWPLSRVIEEGYKYLGSCALDNDAIENLIVENM